MHGTQDPSTEWCMKVRTMIQFRGLSVRSAADEMGIGKGVIEHLFKSDSIPQIDNRLLIDLRMALQPSLLADITGRAIPGSLDYWRSQVIAMGDRIDLLADDLRDVAARMALELESTTSPEEHTTRGRRTRISPKKQQIVEKFEAELEAEREAAIVAAETMRRESARLDAEAEHAIRRQESSG